MSTKLTKAVHRETGYEYHSRPVVVTLAPAGAQNEALLGLRLKGTRLTYVVAVSDVFRFAAEIHGRRERLAKSAARKNGVPWRRAKREFQRQHTLG